MVLISKINIMLERKKDVFSYREMEEVKELNIYNLQQVTHRSWS